MVLHELCVKFALIEFYVILLKNEVELNFRSDGIVVALTALQLQWELAARITFVNETRPFRPCIRK